MKNRRGQFYLIAMLLIVAIFIGIITVENYAETQSNIVTTGLDQELSLEKMNVLDYLANIDSTDANSKIVLINFSKSYIDRIGRNKNILFIVGKSNDALIVGNSLNDSNLKYNIGSGAVAITQDGEFSLPINPGLSDIEISIDENNYTFNMEEGQNLYYIIKHEYNNEVYIVRG